jgi:ornithine decarboxylase
MTDKIARFLEERRPETPCLIIDLDVIAESYKTLSRVLPLAQIFYAVKANPAEEVVDMLVELGSGFDTASRGEIDLVLSHGANPAKVSFGNTIKKERDIAYAFQRGVRLFAFDSDAELEKLARQAPGSKVFCRILMECGGAEWPLSRKFGCSPEMAAGLLARARDLGLDPYGLSFHVGSQQTDLSQWDVAIGRAAAMFRALQELNIDLRMINIGGGFPARYRHEIASIDAYGDAVMGAITTHFGNKIPEIIVEPGRSMVGEAGIIQSEVVLISEKGDGDDRRWVYLDIGKFGGLAETMDEAIKYRIVTPHDNDNAGAVPVVLAGPTCDSADILYEKTEYRMPANLAIGDKVEILSTGAYTSSYCSVNFNGFAPLKTYCV